MRASPCKSRVAARIAQIGSFHHAHVQSQIFERNKDMPEEEILERAREVERGGKSPSTQAGESVREEMEHIREGKHGERWTNEAIGIGLAKALRPGVRRP